MTSTQPGASQTRAQQGITIVFSEREPYNIVGSPRGRVNLKDKLQHNGDWITWALVDTGASHLHLPEEALAYVGLSRPGAMTVPVLTAGGDIITMYQLDVDVEIQGARITTACNFGPGAKPLIGRSALFKAMRTAGFNASDWLIEWHAQGGNQGPQIPSGAKEALERLKRRQGPVTMPAGIASERSVPTVRVDGPWLYIDGVRVPRHVLTADQRRELWKRVRKEYRQLDPAVISTIIRDYLAIEGSEPSGVLLGDVLV